MTHFEIILRFFLSVLIGSIIGFERKSKLKPAGMITHSLVCVGAAIISMIQINISESIIDFLKLNPLLVGSISADKGRIIAQIVSGIGFLGAGTILHEKNSIKGITTAATLWVVACIGIAVGMGYYFLSIFSGMGVFLVINILKKVELYFVEKLKIKKLNFNYKNFKEKKEIQIYLRRRNIKILGIDFEKMSELNDYINASYIISIPRYIDEKILIKEIESFSEIKNLKII